MLAFIRGASTFYGPGDIYVKLLPDGEPVPLTHDGASKVGPLGFSPDGARIAYTVGSPYETWSVPVLGGEPTRMLANAQVLSYTNSTTKPDHVMYSALTGEGIHMGIFTATESRSEERIVYMPADTDGMAHKSFLSPGRQMGDRGGNGSDPMAALPAGSLRRELGGTPRGPGARAVHLRGLDARRKMDVFFREHGKRIPYLAPAFSRRRAGAGHLWRNRGERRFVRARWQSRSSLPSAKARAACGFTMRKASGRLRSKAMPTCHRSRPTPSGCITCSAPARIAISSAGNCGRWILQSGQKQRLLPDFLMEHYAVSPDGEQIVFINAEGSGRESLWIGTADGSSPPRRLVNQDCTSALFAPDGEIYFAGGDYGKHVSAKDQPDGSGLQRVIPEKAIFLYDISPDGKWLAVWTAARTDIKIYPSGGGPPTLLCSGCASAGAEERGVTPPIVSWSRDGKELYLYSDAIAPGLRDPAQTRSAAASLTAVGDLLEHCTALCRGSAADRSSAAVHERQSGGVRLSSVVGASQHLSYSGSLGGALMKLNRRQFCAVPFDRAGACRAKFPAPAADRPRIRERQQACR